jgi:hypothetical protein
MGIDLAVASINQSELILATSIHYSGENMFRSLGASSRLDGARVTVYSTT